MAGDDHVAKSSTAAHQSDHIFKACGTPVFFPSNVQEILDLGLHAIAMSRFSGVWSGMKTIQEIVESSATAVIDPHRVHIVIPEFEMPAGGLHIRWPDTALEQEARLFDYKWYAALAYVRANRLNHNVIEGPNDRLGLIASGKAFNDTRQALLDLGLDDATCRRLGIRLHKVAVVWPLDAQLTREFATGLQEILVIEEKRQVIEYQLKEELYNWRADVRPNVLGKFNEIEGDFSGGEWSMPNPTANTLLRANADLNPALIAKAMVQRLKKTGILESGGADMVARVEAQMAILEAKERSMQVLQADGVAGADRVPWFCSGCPHNTSTVVPEGSRAMAGIGCHYMANWMDRATVGFTQMGGEGVPWIGQSPFSTEKHIFANLGDGTYFHSGLLAIRQSIVAGVNITYKILYNDAVAMTGGQAVGERPEGHSVLQIAESLHAEGAAKVVIVSDEPEKYQGVAIPGAYNGEKVAVRHRDQLDDIQREFREIAGTTAIIYDQTCATEKRRRRKRGKLATPDKTVVINELVCEGCGDCSVQSNCLSVQPLETEFGRKRQIDQSACNKDFSCIKGFCPSFVTLEGAEVAKPKGVKIDPALFDQLPEPALAAVEECFGLMVTGIGGTGVVTISNLIGAAAQAEGRVVQALDLTGLAQKFGSVQCHLKIANDPDKLKATRLSVGQCDVLIGADIVTSASDDALARFRKDHTLAVVNAHESVTGAFTEDREFRLPIPAQRAAIERFCGEGQVTFIDTTELARKLTGNTIGANMMLLGFVCQKGWLPVRVASLEAAIEANGVAVKANLEVFRLGRLLAHDAGQVTALAESGRQERTSQRLSESLDELVARRVADLTAYQDAAYAARYRELVDRVAAAEQAAAPRSDALTRTVARNYFKLLAYKDEFEVARLLTDAEFLASLKDGFTGDFRMTFHLAPPLLSKHDPISGRPRKMAFGPWLLPLLRVLAKGRRLRGTWLDPFARHAERRAERALIGEYEATVDTILQGLVPGTLKAAVLLADWPDQVRGYGPVKNAAIAQAAAERERLTASFASSPQHLAA